MKSSRSGLLLIEILMTILFFSIAGAVCLQIYAKAHMIDKATTNSTARMNGFRISQNHSTDVKQI